MQEVGHKCLKRSQDRTMYKTLLFFNAASHVRHLQCFLMLLYMY